jgi:hypothetical protein
MSWNGSWPRPSAYEQRFELPSATSEENKKIRAQARRLLIQGMENAQDSALNHQDADSAQKLLKKGEQLKQDLSNDEFHLKRKVKPPEPLKPPKRKHQAVEIGPSQRAKDALEMIKALFPGT